MPVAALSRKIAALFCAALKAAAPAVFADISASVDAVLSYLSRYVFRTAISNARILGMDQSHVTFRWKDRSANGWRTEPCRSVEFTQSDSFSMSCREGFTKSDTTGSGTLPSVSSPTAPGCS